MKKEEIIYKSKYFYFDRSWWIIRTDNHFIGCSRIPKEQVPQEYLT